MSKLIALLILGVCTTAALGQGSPSQLSMPTLTEDKQASTPVLAISPKEHLRVSLSPSRYADWKGRHEHMRTIKRMCSKHTSPCGRGYTFVPLHV